VIVAERATQEGTYVALARAREQTDLHASLQQLDIGDQNDELDALAQHLGRSEPDVPSIRTPLAHEHTILQQHTRELDERSSTPAARREITPPGGARQPSPVRRHQAHDLNRQDSVMSPSVSPVLGPRPSAGDPNLAAWERAANANEQCRTHYHIAQHDPVLLGPAPCRRRPIATRPPRSPCRHPRRARQTRPTRLSAPTSHRSRA
jgi:hypothetical protein